MDDGDLKNTLLKVLECATASDPARTGKRTRAKQWIGEQGRPAFDRSAPSY